MSEMTLQRSWHRMLAGAALVLAALPVPAQAPREVDLRFGMRLVTADVYPPQSGDARGTVILAHGFLRDRRSLAALAAALAARGALVIVPDLPYPVDAEANGAALVELITDLRAGRFGAVPARTILVGFSAGGLASLWAAAHAPGVTGWIGLDPVDRNGTGLHVASRTSPPAVILRAAPDRCNAWANSHSWGSFLPRLERDTLIDGATHCDFEDPSDVLCVAACGAPDAQRQARIRDEVIGVVEQWLQ
jgi:pimeloyl-ACP methyl ester carboxylesterase